MSPVPAESNEEAVRSREEEDGLASVADNVDKEAQVEAGGVSTRTPRIQRRRMLPRRFQDFQVETGDLYDVAVCVEEDIINKTRVLV